MQCLACLDLPDMRGAIVCLGRKVLIVRRYHQREDRRALQGAESSNFLPLRYIPDAHVLGRRGKKKLSVWAEGKLVGKMRVHPPFFAPCFNVPQSDGVATSRGQHL